MNLLLCLHPFTYRVKTKCSCHFHQLGQKDFSIFSFLKPLHEASVKLNQIKPDPL